MSTAEPRTRFDGDAGLLEGVQPRLHEKENFLPYSQLLSANSMIGALEASAARRWSSAWKMLLPFARIVRPGSDLVLMADEISKLREDAEPIRTRMLKGRTTGHRS